MSTITLPNIRVSSDLEIRLKLKDGGVAIDWSTLTNIKASIYSDRQRSLAGRCDIAIDEEDSTILVCRYSANKPQYPGVNRVIVSCTYDGETKTYDKPAFTFVRWTDDQAGQSITIDDPDIDVEITVEDISSSILQEAVEAANSAAERANDAAAAAEHMVDIHTGPAGADGADGKSAYELAVEEGYTGTEEEWLASLHGADGTDGTDGTDGKSAYEIAVDEGFVGTEEQWLASLKGEQGNTGSSVDYPYELVNNLTTNDATKGLSAAQGKVLKGELTQLEAEVGDLAEELHEVNPHITGRMGIGNSNEDITTSTLPEYTDQYGIATLVLDSPGYLWVCLENDSFRVTSGGIEIPMVYVKEDGDLHCFVSAEMVNAGTLQFKVESIHPIKSDTERLTITARSYTITYGDEMPELGYTANGEVEGTPVITCEAVQGSDAGTYAIHIARGTVTDSNAIFVDGILTIEKAELTVTADDKFVELNGQMPAFTMQYSGFVLGEDTSDLDVVPTCTTDAEDTATAGAYTITPSGGVSDNYSFVYVPGILRVGMTTLLSWTAAELFAGKSVGGYIDVSTNKKRTSTNYWGIVINVDGLQGKTVKFTKHYSFFRFAFMKSCGAWTNNGSISFSDATGYTAQVESNADTLSVEIPADTKYIYVYTTYNQNTNTAPDIEITGTAETSKTILLAASLFTANKTIGSNGTVYTGENAKAPFCTTNPLNVASDTFLHEVNLAVATMPAIYDSMKFALALYTATGTFIERVGYNSIPDSIVLGPDVDTFHLIMTGYLDGVNVEISSVPIGDNDIQSIVIDN